MVAQMLEKKIKKEKQMVAQMLEKKIKKEKQMVAQTLEEEARLQEWEIQRKRLSKREGAL